MCANNSNIAVGYLIPLTHTHSAKVFFSQLTSKIYLASSIIRLMVRTDFMNKPPSKDPLHGLTLEKILNELLEFYGWEQLGHMINIKCFTHDPSIKSSLVFLRKTPWARSKVEDLYLHMKQSQ